MRAAPPTTGPPFGSVWGMSSADGFTVAVNAGSAGVIAHVAGDIDLSTGPRLVDEVISAHRSGMSVMLDLSGVEFVDSSGLRALLELKERIGEGAQITIQRPTSRVRDLLRLTHLIDVFNVDSEG